MRKNKLLALLLVLVLVLAGCGESIDDSAIRAEAAAVMDGMIAGDYEACRANISSRISDAELTEAFEQLSPNMARLGEYELNLVEWKRNISGDVDQTAIRYLVVTEQGNYQLDVTKIAGETGLVGFFISDAEEETVRAAEPAGVAHWIFLAAGLLGAAFVIWMIVDCARRKMKRKWLWILLSLLGTVLLTVSLESGSFKFQFNIGLYLGTTSLTTYMDGAWLAQIYVPVGALVYFFKRKSLTQTEEANGEEKMEEETNEENPCDAPADEA